MKTTCGAAEPINWSELAKGTDSWVKDKTGDISFDTVYYGLTLRMWILLILVVYVVAAFMGFLPWHRACPSVPGVAGGEEPVSTYW